MSRQSTPAASATESPWDRIATIASAAALVNFIHFLIVITSVAAMNVTANVANKNRRHHFGKLDSPDISAGFALTIRVPVGRPGEVVGEKINECADAITQVSCLVGRRHMRLYPASEYGSTKAPVHHRIRGGVR